jgi:hypothetical protein
MPIFTNARFRFEHLREYFAPFIALNLFLFFLFVRGAENV